MSGSILHSQWYNSNSCSGPPNSIYMFPLVDVYNPYGANITSSFFEFQLGADDIYPGYCGVRTGYDLNQCCASSLDIESSFNYQSGFIYYVMDESEYMESMLMTGTNGYNYCTIIPTNQEGTFERMMFLADGKCVDDYYKCLSNGTFIIHQDKMCETPIEIIHLTDIPEETWSENFEDVTVMFETVRSGKSTKNWISYMPPETLVPNTSNAEDLVTHICFVVFFLCVSQLLWYSIKRYRQQPNRYWFYMIILQVFRIFVRAGLMFYYYTIFTNLISYYWCTFLVFTPLALESLFTTLLITHQLFSLNIKFLNPKWKIWIMMILILSNLVLNLNYYILFRNLPNSNVYFSIEFLDVFRRLPTFWTTFVMIWDSLPILLIASVLCKNQLQQSHFNWNLIKTVLKVDRVFNLIIAIQIFIVLLFGVLGYIQFNTNILGSDRIFLTIAHFRSTMYGLHGLCSGLLIDRLKSFIPKVVEAKDSVITSKVTTQ